MRINMEERDSLSQPSSKFVTVFGGRRESDKTHLEGQLMSYGNDHITRVESNKYQSLEDQLWAIRSENLEEINNLARLFSAFDATCVQEVNKKDIQFRIGACKEMIDNIVLLETNKANMVDLTLSFLEANYELSVTVILQMMGVSSDVWECLRLYSGIKTEYSSEKEVFRIASVAETRQFIITQIPTTHVKANIKHKLESLFERIVAGVSVDNHMSDLLKLIGDSDTYYRLMQHYKLRGIVV